MTIFKIIGILAVIAFWVLLILFMMRIQARIQKRLYARSPKPRRPLGAKFRSWAEKDAQSLVSFFIGNGGIDGNGLDTLFSGIDDQGIDEELMYAALKHYGVGSIVPFLREAHQYYWQYHRKNLNQKDFQRYSSDMTEFGLRINVCSEIEILTEAYNTNGASLEAKNTVDLA
jgi:hypothetical protein